jgi:glycosyltransferase involved in cell wall biosynthesis
VKSITILTGNHLCHNPRVFKEARCLAEAGYNVRVLGGVVHAELGRRDSEMAANQPFTYEAGFSLIDPKPMAHFDALLIKARRRVGFEAKRCLGLDLPSSLGYGTREILRNSLRQPADLYIAHSEPTLWVAQELHQRGHRVGVDMEDWFSEDLPLKARAVRPVHLLKKLEKFILTTSIHATCTSHAMAQELSKSYGCPAPKVIYNAFPWEDRTTIDGERLDRKRDSQKPSIYWFSQSLGPDRGLETLFRALPLLTRDVEVHLRGNVGPYGTWLRDVIPESWADRIFIHPLVRNDELLSRISEHDIGFAGETADARNHDVTVSNKILHYMLGGLAIVASDTAGQREIADSCSAVCLFQSGNVRSLAHVLNQLLASTDALSKAKAAALACAKRHFCWEAQTDQLLESVNAALTCRTERTAQ